MSLILWSRDGGVADEAIAGALDAMDLRARKAGWHPSFVVEGIAIGGCIDAFGTSRQGMFRRSAHAHTHARSPNRGWLCFRSAKRERVIGRSGRPTRLFWHEWAHIAANDGHTARFVQLLHDVGQHAEAKASTRALVADIHRGAA